MPMNNNLPVWSDIELRAIDIFVSQTQDINLYVEDTDSEIFYETLMDKLLNKDIKINKIIPLNGRDNVINYCKEYTDSTPALFIIDSDLYLSRKEQLVGLERLYQHDKYCIENYLFSLYSLVELIFETVASKTKDNIKTEIEWNSIIENIENTLLKLFIEFATIHKLDKSIQTVKIGINNLFKELKKDKYEICEVKVAKLIEEKKKELFIKNAINQNIQTEYESIKNTIEENIKSIEDKTSVISGKHFLIYILYKIFNKYAPGAQVKMNSFKLRLAKNCEVEKLAPLKEAIYATVQGNIYFK
jgi:hypothetical protein